MKSTHSFEVKASIETIYKNAISAERWLTFVPGSQHVSGDPNWPDEGSSIVVRFGFGPWSSPNTVTVVKHEYGRRFITHEDMGPGRFTDDVSLTFQEEDGTTLITFVNDSMFKSRILSLLMLPLRRIIMELFLFPLVKKRIKALVEA